MIPVKPPAASANSKTAGNQNLRMKWRRFRGGAVTIALGEYDFNFEPGDFAAIELRPLNTISFRMRSEANVGSHSAQLRKYYQVIIIA